jgi:vancomycin permeability regulator SanA
VAAAVRLVAVLGYSTWRGTGLHAICRERLRAAERAAADGDVVLLSGWSRRRHRPAEAALMEAAWAGPDVPRRVDVDARTTWGNVRAAAVAAAELGADEVVLVTSSWHARRALLLARAAMPGVRVTAARGPRSASRRLLAREAACLLPAYATVSASRAFAVWRRFSASSHTALREP